MSYVINGEASTANVASEFEPHVMPLAVTVSVAQSPVVKRRTA